MEHKVKLCEALCGFKLVVKHLDGRQLLITHPQGQIIEPGMLYVLHKTEKRLFFVHKQNLKYVIKSQLQVV